MIKKKPGNLTPYLKNKYEQVLKLKQENPDQPMRVIAKQAGTSHDSFLKAKRLIEGGALVAESKQNAPKAIKKQPTLVTVPIETESSPKPLIALIGTPEDIIRSLNSMFN